MVAALRRLGCRTGAAARPSGRRRWRTCNVPASWLAPAPTGRPDCLFFGQSVGSDCPRKPGPHAQGFPTELSTAAVGFVLRGGEQGTGTRVPGVCLLALIRRPARAGRGDRRGRGWRSHGRSGGWRRGGTGRRGCHWNRRSRRSRGRFRRRGRGSRRRCCRRRRRVARGSRRRFGGRRQRRSGDGWQRSAGRRRDCRADGGRQRRPGRRRQRRACRRRQHRSGGRRHGRPHGWRQRRADRGRRRRSGRSRRRRRRSCRVYRRGSRWRPCGRSRRTVRSRPFRGFAAGPDGHGPGLVAVLVEAAAVLLELVVLVLALLRVVVAAAARIPAATVAAAVIASITGVATVPAIPTIAGVAASTVAGVATATQGPRRHHDRRARGGDAGVRQLVVVHGDVADAQHRLHAELGAHEVLVAPRPGLAAGVLARGDMVDDRGQVDLARGERQLGGDERDQLPAGLAVGAAQAAEVVAAAAVAVLGDVDVVELAGDRRVVVVPAGIAAARRVVRAVVPPVGPAGS